MSRNKKNWDYLVDSRGQYIPIHGGGGGGYGRGGGDRPSGARGWEDRSYGARDSGGEGGGGYDDGRSRRRRGSSGGGGGGDDYSGYGGAEG